MNMDDKVTMIRIPSNAMDEEDFLALKGVRFSSSGFVLDKLRCNMELSSERRKKRFYADCERAEAEYQAKREQAKKENRELVEKGELRPRTPIERSLCIAQGNPDNESVQAARRVCLKRGYDWRTGKKLTEGGAA